MFERFRMGAKKESAETNKRALLKERLTQIKDEVAPDYQIPETLWDQMVTALERGSEASGGAFSVEELQEFNNETRARLGDYLAEATAGIVPGTDKTMFDSAGTFIGRGSADELQRRVEEERNA